MKTKYESGIVNEPLAWGRSDQKMLIVKDVNFDELYEHLKDNKWMIDTILPCAGICGFYALLERN